MYDKSNYDYIVKELNDIKNCVYMNIKKISHKYNDFIKDIFKNMSDMNKTSLRELEILDGVRLSRTLFAISPKLTKNFIEFFVDLNKNSKPYNIYQNKNDDKVTVKINYSFGSLVKDKASLSFDKNILIKKQTNHMEIINIFPFLIESYYDVVNKEIIIDINIMKLLDNFITYMTKLLFKNYEQYLNSRMYETDIQTDIKNNSEDYAILEATGLNNQFVLDGIYYMTMHMGILDTPVNFDNIFADFYKEETVNLSVELFKVLFEQIEYVSSKDFVKSRTITIASIINKEKIESFVDNFIQSINKKNKLRNVPELYLNDESLEYFKTLAIANAIKIINNKTVVANGKIDYSSENSQNVSIIDTLMAQLTKLDSFITNRIVDLKNSSSYQVENLMSIISNSEQNNGKNNQLLSTILNKILDVKKETKFEETLNNEIKQDLATYFKMFIQLYTNGIYYDAIKMAIDTSNVEYEKDYTSGTVSPKMEILKYMKQLYKDFQWIIKEKEFKNVILHIDQYNTFNKDMRNNFINRFLDISIKNNNSKTMSDINKLLGSKYELNTVEYYSAELERFPSELNRLLMSTNAILKPITNIDYNEIAIYINKVVECSDKNILFKKPDKDLFDMCDVQTTSLNESYNPTVKNKLDLLESINNLLDNTKIDDIDVDTYNKLTLAKLYIISTQNKEI